jgi:hypothetical protein
VVRRFRGRVRGYVIERSGDGSWDRGGVPRNGNVGPTPSNVTSIGDLSASSHLSSINVVDLKNSHDPMAILLVAQSLRIRQIRVDHDERIELFSLVVRERSQADLGLLQGLPQTEKTENLHISRAYCHELRSR